MGGAVGTISAAFQALSTQDFAEAKVKSLGVNAEQLTQNLREVSRELQGQKSVVELTAAAYDVASAGFADAASASTVLKAASQGAIGGFSDLNTVANATTSVLNAYGMSAANAGSLVDQFIQTQNDGKIVVAEYAANIGKVASAAAGLGIPLAEVNAVIAQATASGVQAEVAFTGLKSALARLASGEASNAIKETGIQIDAASLKTDGLVGTFQKLKDAGLDTGQIFKALGTEAGPALLPVLNNLEKYQQLVENQKNSQGAAAQATLLATDTIQGAWNRLAASFQNLFADQSELGEALKWTLSAAAGFVEGLAAAFKTMLAPIRAVINIITEIGKAFGLFKEGQNLLMELNQLWFEAQGYAQTFADVVVYTGQVAGEAIGGIIGWVQNLFGSIASGAQGVIPAITSPFQQAFDNAKAIIQGFWNSLPGWLKGALSAAGNIAGGIAKAVTGALGKVQQDIKSGISEYVAKAKGSAGSLFAGNVPKVQTTSPTGTSPTGGGGGGKTGKSEREKQLEKEAALAKRMEEQFARLNQSVLNGNYAYAERLNTQQRLNALLLEGFTPEKAQEQVAFETEINRLQRERAQKIEELRGIENITQDKLITGEQTINQAFDQRIRSLYEEKQLKGEILERTEAQKKAEEELNAQRQIGADALNSVGSQIAGTLDTLIQGTEDWNKVLQNTLKSLASMLLKFGIKSLAGTDGEGFFSFLDGSLKGFASGGRPPVGKASIVGERGPELFVPGTSGTIIPNDALGGSGGTVVNITLNGVGGGSSSASGSKKEEAAQLARMVEAATVGVIQRERRPGGLLAR